MRLLLDKGADINAKDSKGETALNKAEGRAKSETAKLLRDRGAL